MSVTFITKRYPDYVIVMEPTAHTLVTDENGRQRTLTIPAKQLRFKGYEYTTSDPKEIEFLRNAGAFTGKNESVIDYEEMLPPDPEMLEHVQLINEFGYKKVSSILKKVKEKAIQKRKSVK